MEDIGDDSSKNWPIDLYGLVARHLGQFNGPYLAGKSIPDQPWLSFGRVKEWTAAAEPAVKKLADPKSESLLRPWVNADIRERIMQLWADRGEFLAALERLPTTFCHHDAFRRNLITRKGKEGKPQTVAFDWALAGTGAVGQEVCPLIFVSLSWLDVDIKQARELQAAAIAGYVDGLRDAGWQGDPRMAQLGCFATAALQLGISWTGAGGLSWFEDREKDIAFPKRIGHPLDQVVMQQARLLPYLLDIADEARKLIDLNVL